MGKYILVVRANKIRCAHLELELDAEHRITRSKLVPESKSFLVEQSEGVRRAARTVLNAQNDLKQFVMYQQAEQWYYASVDIQPVGAKKKLVKLGESVAFQVDPNALRQRSYSVRVTGQKQPDSKGVEEDFKDWELVEVEDSKHGAKGSSCLCM